MAYRPSQRRSFEIEPTEPNLTPIMNLMVVLIPLLLTSAEFVKLGEIDLNLPPAAGPLQSSDTLPREGTKSLDLILFVTAKQFIVVNALPKISQQSAKKVTISRNDGQALNKLQTLLFSIKQQTPEYYRERDRIRIQADASVKYQDIMQIIEISRSINRGNETIKLFPDVQLSAGIL